MNSFKRYEEGVLVEYRINGIPQEKTASTFLGQSITKIWPIFLRPMKLLAQPDDKGLGDIIERVIGPVGGDDYKLWYKTTFGHSCPGCNKRKNDLNLRYPLPQLNDPARMP